MTTSDVQIDLRAKLRQVFGFKGFRPGQKRAVEAAVEGRDTLVVMPTGSGKSLCFQLPALALPGTTVVVSPLIALMKDQVDHLAELGVAAIEVHSGVCAAELAEAERLIAAGAAVIVYTTPERLARPEFLDLLKRTTIDLIVVDEAHCISDWGHDFRPEYRMLGDAADALGRPPILALTATATPEVVADILDRLRMPDATVVHNGFYRPNLHLEVVPVEDEEARRAELLRLLQSSEGSGIVYAATVKEVGELAQWLGSSGIEVDAYHGRMKAADRTAAQDRFMSGASRVMVATNAFGLGIDKPDIRFVVHHRMPATLESYYQEAGRAGRDGQPARCTLLHRSEDRALARFFQSGRQPGVDDLMNTYNVLTKGTEAGPATIDELMPISPLKKARLQQALTLFRDQGIAARGEDGRYAVARPELELADFQRLHGRLREREEQDRLRIQRAVEYAEGIGCRWEVLLDYFGRDDAPGDRCGHCDRCEPRAA